MAKSIKNSKIIWKVGIREKDIKTTQNRRNYSTDSAKQIKQKSNY
jgi:hypothetical protein